MRYDVCLRAVIPNTFQSYITEKASIRAVALFIPFTAKARLLIDVHHIGKKFQVFSESTMTTSFLRSIFYHNKFIMLLINMVLLHSICIGMHRLTHIM